MRIGSTIIDTDNMAAEEVNILIEKLIAIRERKELVETFSRKLERVLQEAHSRGVDFIDKDLGHLIEFNDIMVIDRGE